MLRAWKALAARGAFMRLSPCGGSPSSRLALRAPQLNSMSIDERPRRNGAAPHCAYSGCLNSWNSMRTPCARERVDVEVAARAAEAGEQRVGADRLAHAQDQIGARALDRRARSCARAACATPNASRSRSSPAWFDVDQLLPARLEQALELGGVGAEVRGLAVRVAQRGEVVRRPPLRCRRCGCRPACRRCALSASAAPPAR